jgi:DNA-binding GntR family transcriptional regulator
MWFHVGTGGFPENLVLPGVTYSDHMLDHDSPVPLHEQLSAILRDQVKSGRLTGRVPSARSLAEEYGVSHRTSERSLNTLRDEGLLVAVVGKGYYVTRK